MPYERTAGLLMAIMSIALPFMNSAARASIPELWEETLECIRGDPLGTVDEQRTFVVDSLQYVENGADRVEIVNGLAAIATLRGSHFSREAVAALFFIGDGYEAIEVHDVLFRIITSDSTAWLVRDAAVRYLTLVADELIRSRLLEFVAFRWGTQAAHDAGRVLYDCGDAEYLQFLEQKVKEEKGSEYDEDRRASIRRSEIDWRLRQMRLAHGPLPEILSAIASTDRMNDRRYLVQQASRHGADLRPYAAAVVKFLSRAERHCGPSYNGPLIKDCILLRVFTLDQTMTYFMHTGGRAVGVPRSIIPWATGFVSKWVKAYTFEKKGMSDD